ncbi:MAG: DUF429 domain-containing protein [Candidatus Woesearchaeota archaeon]
MIFIGIDLAWSERNASGVAALSADKAKVLVARTARSDEEILDFVQEQAGDKSCIIAIDAPLIVPNRKKGSRKNSRRMFQEIQRRSAPGKQDKADAVDRKNQGRRDSKLIKIGFEHNPSIKKHEKTRKFFEVYPHPSMVVLFNLGSILKYKAKPKRTYESRWKKFKKYTEKLTKLSNPRIVLPKEFTGKTQFRGKQLKTFEDRLDAIFCAYIAHYNWCHPERCRILEDMKKGYISTSVFDRKIY